MSPGKSADVLIVGSGPTGLICALTLAKNGIPVRIIEKLTEWPNGQRGAATMPRSLELYHFLGLLEDIKRTGDASFTIKQYDSEGGARTFPMFPLIEKTPSVPEDNVFFLGQDMACALLRSKLKEFGVEVELRSSPVSIKQHENGVTVEISKQLDGQEMRETIEVGYVVGADGAKGAVRKMAGLSFLGESRDSIGLVVGDLEIFGLDRLYWHSWGSPPNNQVVLRPTDRYEENIYFILASGPDLDRPRAAQDIDYLTKFIHDVTKYPGLKVGRATYMADWRPNIRMAESFQSGRVLIAGDAAHVHSPTGGQGMNSGLQDSVNLGWKLALVCKKLAPPRLLETYAEERVPVIREMLQHTTTLLNKTFDAKRKAADSPWTRPTSLLQLGVHYRWSSIVRDERVIRESAEENSMLMKSTYGIEGPGQLHAGDRAPDAPGLVDVRTKAECRLFNIFSLTRHTVLILVNERERAVPVIDVLGRHPSGTVHSVVIYSQLARDVEDVPNADLVMCDRDGHAFTAYQAPIDVDPMSVAIIRPDCVVGGLVAGADGVEKYFSNILSD